jgi:hypothetical protein
MTNAEATYISAGYITVRSVKKPENSSDVPAEQPALSQTMIYVIIGGGSGILLLVVVVIVIIVCLVRHKKQQTQQNQEKVEKHPYMEGRSKVRLEKKKKDKSGRKAKGEKNVGDGLMDATESVSGPASGGVDGFNIVDGSSISGDDEFMKLISDSKKSGLALADTDESSHNVPGFTGSTDNPPPPPVTTATFKAPKYEESVSKAPLEDVGTYPKFEDQYSKPEFTSFSYDSKPPSVNVSQSQDDKIIKRQQQLLEKQQRQQQLLLQQQRGGLGKKGRKGGNLPEAMALETFSTNKSPQEFDEFADQDAAIHGFKGGVF